MKSNPFSYTNFFEDPGIFKKLFEQYEYPWEVLPNTEQFINTFKNSVHAQDFTEIKKDVLVGKNVSIESTALIEGPALIGHNTTIGHAAYLRKGVLIGDHAHVGHAVEVKNSIILSGTTLGHLNYVGDSILGSAVKIAGGAILANLRFDKKDVNVQFENEKIPTAMRKFGSILGDNCFIGVNAVLNPGTVLTKGCTVFPLTSVKGTYLASQTIK